MGNLSNLYVSKSFQSLIHLGTDNVATPSLTTLQDGYGNSIGIEVNTAGDLFLSGSLTASLEQGYIYVGNASGKTSAFATSSLVTNINTGSLVTTASFNSYTSSNNQRVSSLEAATASYVTETESGSFLITASFDNGTRNLTFTKGNNTTFNVNIPDVSGSTINTGSFATTGSNTFTGVNTFEDGVIANLLQAQSAGVDGGNILIAPYIGGKVLLNKSTEVTGSLIVTETFTASLQQGYVWVGNSAGKTVTVATSSFGGGSTIPTGTVSGSAQITALGFVSSSVTASSLVTASFNNGTRNLTFTKGDASTFSVNIPDVSGSTGNFATTGSNVFVGNQTITGSLLISGSEVVTGPLTASRLQINGITDLNGTLSVSNDTTINGDVSIISTTPNLKLRDTSGGGFSSGYDLRVDTGSFEIYDDTHNRDVLSDFFDSASAQHTTSLTSEIIVISGSTSVTLIGNVSASIISASTINGLGDPLTFSTSVDSRLDSLEGVSGSFVTTSSFNSYTSSTNSRLTNIESTTASLNTSVTNLNSATASLFTSASLGLVTASFSGNTLTFTKGDATTFGVVIPDVSGSTINTGSFATTGSNSFVGNQTIIGSLEASDTIKSQVYINPQTLNGFTIPTGNNAMLVGPVAISGSIVVEGNSNLIVLSQVTGSGTTPLPIGLLSSSVTDFTTYSASVDTRINNIVTGTGFATTGSNIFTGDQNIQGTITASLQQGYVWVGNASGVSTTVPTSSFGGGSVPSGTISGSGQITALGFVSSSITASSLVTASVNLNTITFTKGDSSTFALTIDTGSGGGGSTFPFTGDAVITGSLSVTGSTLLRGNTTFTSNTGDNSSVILGNNAMLNSSGSNATQNVAIGDSALLVTQEKFNVAIGNSSLRDNTTGNQNTGIGFESLRKNTSGGNNFGLGANAMHENIGGNQNIGIGVGALYSNITGSLNTAVGNDAGFANVSGSRNVYIGPNSGNNHFGDNTVIIGGYSGGGQILNNNIILSDGNGNIELQYSGSTWTTENNFVVSGSLSAANDIKMGRGTNKPTNKVTVGSGGLIVSNSLVTSDSYIFATNDTTVGNYSPIVSNITNGSFSLSNGGYGGDISVMYMIVNPY